MSLAKSLKVSLSALWLSSVFLDAGEVLISAEEALVDVAASEQAKKIQIESKQVELENAAILDSAVASIGGRQIVFNRVPIEKIKTQESTSEQVAAVHSNASFEDLISATRKERMTFVVSGTVYDEQISELWWDFNGIRYRVFVKANFSLFPALGAVETETTRYDLLPILTSRSTNVQDFAKEKHWVPSIEDFDSEILEYIVISPADDLDFDPAAFLALEAMLLHHEIHAPKMEIAYRNAIKKRNAQKAYAAENPAPVNDMIINFRPTGRNAERLNR